MIHTAVSITAKAFHAAAAQLHAGCAHSHLCGAAATMSAGVMRRFDVCSGQRDLHTNHVLQHTQLMMADC